MIELNYPARRVITYFICGIAFLALSVPLLYLFRPGSTALKSGTFYLLNTISSVLFIPIVGALLLSMSCITIERTLVSRLHPYDKCFSGNHAISGGISLFLALLIIILVLLYKLCIYSQSLTNSFGKLINSPDVTFHIVRSTMLVILIGIPDIALTYNVAIYLISSVSLYITCSKQNARYSMKAEQLLNIMSGIYTLLGGILIIAIYYSEKVKSILFATVLLVMLIIPILNEQPLKKQLDLIAKKFKKFQKEFDVLHYCIALVRLSSQNNDKGNGLQIMVNNFISRHCFRCKDPFCQLYMAANDMKAGKITKTIYNKLKYYVYRKIRKASIKFPNSINLLQLDIIYSFECVKDYLHAWETLERMKQSGANFFERVQFYHYK